MIIPPRLHAAFQLTMDGQRGHMAPAVGVDIQGVSQGVLRAVEQQCVLAIATFSNVDAVSQYLVHLQA